MFSCSIHCITIPQTYLCNCTWYEQEHSNKSVMAGLFKVAHIWWLGL